MTIEFTPEEARILLGFLGIRIPEQPEESDGSRRQPAEEEKKEPEPKPEKKTVKKHPNQKGAVRTIDRGKLFALAKAGWSTAKIADELGCSQWSVRAILNNEAPYAREEEK